ncbi:MAG: hypothetical protein HONBIEJF_01139 [Fimbriimonadaceae bacterium]|nr:hypothetical protein [Fimbriimonadaceae bacterium]
MVELLTVMAISAILFSIISIPLVQSFNLTRAAQGIADAQDRARFVIDRLTREISNATAVRDNDGLAGSLDIVVPGFDQNPETIRLQNVKLDIVMPAQGDPLNPQFNPDIGKIDPTRRSPKGQVVLPVAPGSTLVRYWVGLRNPLNGNNARPYTNPYDGLLMPRSGEADNLFVLWRAEVQPRVYNPAQNRWEVNTRLFEVDSGTGQPVYDDPAFFIPDGSPAKAARIREWTRLGSVITSISRFDMILPVYNRRTRQVIYDGNVPQIVPLIQLTPTRVSSEPASGQLANRTGEESDNATKVGPDVFRTEFGAWTSAFIRTYPTQYPNIGNAGSLNAASFSRPWPAWMSGTPYNIGRIPGRGQATTPPGFSIYYYDPGTNTNEATQGVEMFDVFAYQYAAGLDPARWTGAADQRRYPFTFAINEANSRSNWLNDPVMRRAFIGLNPNPRGGRVEASFGVDEVGGANNPAIPVDSDNLPVKATGPAYTPNNDPGIGAGDWFDYNDINQRFNKLWQQWPSFNDNWVQGNNATRTNLSAARAVKRYIDLRITPQADGTASPLSPDPATGFARARIVPGSEVVVGPDQAPGPNYGQPVRYSRVTQRPVGPNQYYINYVNQREPDNWYDIARPLPFGIPNNGDPNYGSIYDPQRYEAQNLISAVLQAQYRAGYVELNSAFGEPIPQGNIYVLYRFQFTEPNDVVAVDYDSRQVIGINLTMRVFPQSSSVVNAPTVTVKGTATVRNFLR